MIQECLIQTERRARPSNCGGGRFAQDGFLGLEGRRVGRHARWGRVRRRWETVARRKPAAAAAAVLQHEFVRERVWRSGGGGQGRAAVHGAESQVTELGLQVQLRVVHVVLEVAVGAVAVKLDLLVETHPLSLSGFPPGAFGTFALFVAEERHRPGQRGNEACLGDAAAVVGDKARRRGEYIPVRLGREDAAVPHQGPAGLGNVSRQHQRRVREIFEFLAPLRGLPGGRKGRVGFLEHGQHGGRVDWGDGRAQSEDVVGVELHLLQAGGSGGGGGGAGAGVECVRLGAVSQAVLLQLQVTGQRVYVVNDLRKGRGGVI